MSNRVIKKGGFLSKNGGCCGRLFLEQKIGCAGCVFSGGKKRVCWAIFLEQKTGRAGCFCCSRTTRFVCRLGEIFINLFFDLRLDLPIILFTIFG